MRNVKDVAVSYTHYMRSKTQLGRPNLTLGDTIRMMMDGDDPYGPYYTQIASYWTQRRNSNLFICSYEELTFVSVSLFHQGDFHANLQYRSFIEL